METRLNLRQAIYALSDALDLVGIDDVYHGKRVGIMATECGRALGWNENRLCDLFDAGLLHDCGVSSTQVHRNLVTQLDWEHSQEHCIRGHALLQGFPPLAHLAQTVRYHHTHWDALIQLGLPEPAALQANLIYLADRADALASPYYGQDTLLLQRGKIHDTLRRHSGSLFAPQLVEAFLGASQSEAFWLNLEPRSIALYLADMAASGQSTQLDYATLKQLALLFSTIVDAKSAFTVEHSLGVARLARFLGEKSGLPAETCDKLEIAGLLHDVGKLGVADGILEKPAPLDGRERAAMMRHSFESYQLLRHIPGFEDIALWCAFHHETPDGKGYPFHRHSPALSQEARIVTLADIFQALAQKRPYRDALPPSDILLHLKEFAAAGQLEAALVTLAEQNLEACWQAATGKI